MIETKPKRKIHGTITVGQLKKIWGVRSEYHIPEDCLYNIVEQSAQNRCSACSRGQECGLEHRSISSLSSDAAGDVIQWIEKTIIPIDPDGVTSEDRFIIRGLALKLARVAPGKYGDICDGDYAGLQRMMEKIWSVYWLRMSRAEGQRVVKGLRAMVRYYERK